MIDFFSAYDNIHNEGTPKNEVIKNEDDSGKESTIMEKLESLEQKLTNILTSHEEHGDE